MIMTEPDISDKKIETLSRGLAKAFAIPPEDALSIIYDEWEIVEQLFIDHGKVKEVLEYLVYEINYSYRIA
ncbi:MAG: hypothetical protein HF962_07215 [Sulfurovum sp.]|nr:hypothetical protein [Sulfurovum sp.]